MRMTACDCAGPPCGGVAAAPPPDAAESLLHHPPTRRSRCCTTPRRGGGGAVPTGHNACGEGSRPRLRQESRCRHVAWSCPWSEPAGLSSWHHSARTLPVLYHATAGAQVAAPVHNQEGSIEVKGPPLLWRRLGRWATPCGPSDGPTLTRLSSGGPGQATEATTLVPSLRPTRGPRLRGGFLNPDHSKPRLQTSSGSCTKQGTRRAGREVALGTNMAEGRERERSVPFRYTPGRKAQGVPPRKGHRVGVGGHALLVAARAFGIRVPLSRSLCDCLQRRFL
jgi:hypothetical protein